MKKDLLSRAVAATTGRNPTAVLEAWLPAGGLICDMRAVLLLERLGSPLLTGNAPNLSDLLIAILAMSDYDALAQAHRKGKVPELLDDRSLSLRPADLLSRAPEIQSALTAAFAPADTGTSQDSDDPEKKTPAAP